MKNILYIFIASICISCTSAIESTIETIPIAVNNNSTLAEFISNGRTIQLETNDECLISEINKLCIDSDYFYIMDKMNEKIFIFDQQGKFISKIDSHGNGPDEYIELTDISVNNKTIYALSRPNKSIYVYSNSGKFNKKINLNDWYQRLNVTNDCIMLYSCKSNQQLYDIVTIDHEGNIIKKNMPFAKNESYIFNIVPFNKISDEEYLLCFPYERRVALFNKTNCEYKYKFDFKTEVNFTDKEMEELGYDKIRNSSLYKESLKQIDCITRLEDKFFLMIATVFLNGKGLRKVLVKSDFSTQLSQTYIVGDEIEQDFPLFDNPVLIKEDKVYCVTSNINISDDFEEHNPSIGIYQINRNK